MIGHQQAGHSEKLVVQLKGLETREPVVTASNQSKGLGSRSSKGGKRSMFQLRQLRERERFKLDAHPHWGGLSALLSSSIQILFSSGNTLADTFRTDVQSGPVKLTHTINHHSLQGAQVVSTCIITSKYESTYPMLTDRIFLIKNIYGGDTVLGEDAFFQQKKWNIVTRAIIYTISTIYLFCDFTISVKKLFNFVGIFRYFK